MAAHIFQHPETNNTIAQLAQHPGLRWTILATLPPQTIDLQAPHEPWHTDAQPIVTCGTTLVLLIETLQAPPFDPDAIQTSYNRTIHTTAKEISINTPPWDYPETTDTHLSNPINPMGEEATLAWFMDNP